MTAEVRLPVINQSQVKDWRLCQKKWDYRYAQRLQPKRRERPLHLGSWFHACLEGFYRDGDWKPQHEIFLTDYNNLFEEERAELDRGSEPLPEQVERMMKSYLWYYRNDGWKVIAVEQEGEVDMTTLFGEEFGYLPWTYKFRVDLIVEDADGLRWVVDHKTTDSIPAVTMFHAADPQLVLYPVGVEAALGIKTDGVIYNYIESRAPSIPKLTLKNKLSEAKIKTDYPTAYRFIKQQGWEPKDYSHFLLPLQAESPFLARYRMPREPEVTQRILMETATTAREIISHSAVTRNVTRNCSWCSYMALCRAELFGLDATAMRRTQYTIEEEGRETTGDTDEG